MDTYDLIVIDLFARQITNSYYLIDSPNQEVVESLKFPTQIRIISRPNAQYTCSNLSDNDIQACALRARCHKSETV